MPYPLSKSLIEQMAAGFTNRFAAEPLWLAVCRQERAEASLEECEVCSALQGGILFPELTSLSVETLIEAVEEHKHFKTVYTPVIRAAAHAETNNGLVRVIPDVDMPFVAEDSGFYRLTISTVDDVELASVDLDAMPAGSILSTLTVDIGIPESR
jgi:hypothetical protein